MPAKKWKYAEDCARQLDFIRATAAGKPPAGKWAVVARKIVMACKKTKCETTPFALHFIALSATEMLSGRHGNAKICMVMAMAQVNTDLKRAVLSLYNSMFQTPKDVDDMGLSLEEAMGSAFGALMSQLPNLPEGASQLDLAPGVKAHVVKQKVGTCTCPECLGGNPRLN